MEPKTESDSESKKFLRNPSKFKEYRENFREYAEGVCV